MTDDTTGVERTRPGFETGETIDAHYREALAEAGLSAPPPIR